MNCRSAEPLFSALIEDELSQKERRDLEAHLLGCRRCSAGVRELRATLTLLREVPAVETSPHFLDDVLARVRSGEALRPGLLEWAGGLLAPFRLRPLVAAGAGICAVAVAVVLVVRPVGWTGGTHAPAVASAPAAPAAPKAVVPTPAAPGSAASLASRPPSSAAREVAGTQLAGAPLGARAQAASDSAGLQDRKDTGYQDEYIMDQFLLERSPSTGDPAMVPASGNQNDDVYIEF